MKKFIPLFYGLFASLFAVTDVQYQELQKRVAALESKPINPAATCGKEGWGVVLTAEPLYWKVSQEGLEYAITASYDLVVDNYNATTPFYKLNVSKGKAHAPDFDWNWGFRVGLGYKIPRDGWDLGGKWARYHHSASDRIERSGDPNPNNIPSVANAGSGQFISPFWVAQLFATPGLMNRAKALWNLHLDVGDIALGREFFLSDYLVVKPFIGLRGAWVDQTYRLSFLTYDYPNNPDDIAKEIYVKMKNDMKGIGGRLGLSTKWLLKWGFSVCAEGAFSALYSRVQLSYFLHDRQYVPILSPFGNGSVGNFPIFNGTAPFDDSYGVKNSFHTSTYVGDLFLGLCWERSFREDRFCMKVWAGYEQSIYFQQNRFMNHQYDFSLISPFNSAVIQGGNEGPNYFSDRGNMTVAGGSGGLTFSF